MPKRTLSPSNYAYVPAKFAEGRVEGGAINRIKSPPVIEYFSWTVIDSPARGEKRSKGEAEVLKDPRPRRGNEAAQKFLNPLPALFDAVAC